MQKLTPRHILHFSNTRPTMTFFSHEQAQKERRWRRRRRNILTIIITNRLCRARIDRGAKRLKIRGIELMRERYDVLFFFKISELIILSENGVPYHLSIQTFFLNKNFPFFHCISHIKFRHTNCLLIGERGGRGRQG